MTVVESVSCAKGSLYLCSIVRLQVVLSGVDRSVCRLFNFKSAHMHGTTAASRSSSGVVRKIDYSHHRFFGWAGQCVRGSEDETKKKTTINGAFVQNSNVLRGFFSAWFGALRF